MISIAVGTGCIVLGSIIAFILFRYFRRHKKTFPIAKQSEMPSGELTGDVAPTEHEGPHNRNATKSVEFSFTDREKEEFDEN